MADKISRDYKEEHMSKMYWILRNIREIQYCEVCNKVIMRLVYSNRNSDEICCSFKCLDEYPIIMYERYYNYV
jgi:hypothetical protein